MSRAVSRILRVALKLSRKLFVSFREPPPQKKKLYFRSYSFADPDKRKKILGWWATVISRKLERKNPRFLELIRNPGRGYWIPCIEFILGWLGTALKRGTTKVMEMHIVTWRVLHRGRVWCLLTSLIFSKWFRLLGIERDKLFCLGEMDLKYVSKS